MVDENRRQVNDDDVTNKMILGARAMKVVGQVESMKASYLEAGFILSDEAALLLNRVTVFIEELNSQLHPVEYQLEMGGIPKMPVGDMED